MSFTPLTASEANAVADELDHWPGGFGYVLRKSTRSPRGWADSGFHPKEFPRKMPDVTHDDNIL